MKILAIGDFHGTFPNKFYKIINKEKIDVVVSNGDYPPFHYRKLWFKHCYGVDTRLWQVIGKKKHKALITKDLDMAEVPLKKLNDLNVPVLTVLGNIDIGNDDISDRHDKIKSKLLKWERSGEFFSRLEKYKKLKRFDYSFVKFRDYIFVGMRGGSAPGMVKSKAFRKHKKILDKLFKKFNKENKEGKVVFVSHNIAYGTKLDKINKKDFHKVKKGRYAKSTKKINPHYGSKMARRIINQYHPILHIGGHIHEGRGKQKLGRSWLVNPGSAHEGHAAIIEMSDEKVKEIKFVR